MVLSQTLDRLLEDACKVNVRMWIRFSATVRHAGSFSSLELERKFFESGNVFLIHFLLSEALTLPIDPSAQFWVFLVL
jgi:hypothetical protein